MDNNATERIQLNKNLLTAAIAGEDVPVIDEVAKTEGVKPNFLRRQIASGRVAVMQRDGKPSYAPDFMTNAQR